MSLFVRRTLVQGIVLMMFTALAVADAKASRRPPVEFDTTSTPLQKAVKDAYVKNAEKKKNKMPGGEKKDKCADAIARGNENQILQFCDDVGSAELTKLADQDLKHADGKAAGKRVVTRTKLKYKSPKHKGDDAAPATWAATKFKSFEKQKQHSPGPVSDPNGGQSVGGTFLPDAADNNDKDCVDWVSSERFRGTQCFDATGKLLGTLTLFTDDSGRTGCKHRGGSAFLGDATDKVEDECFDENDVLKTTLVESIDEDGPETLDNDGDNLVDEDGPGNGNEDNDCIDGLGNVLRGSACSGVGSLGEALRPLVDEDGPETGANAIDNDGDGQKNEDGPDHVQDVCSRLYTKAGLTPMASDRDADGQCDVTRLMRKYVNDKAGKKIFNAKDDGTPDSESTEGIAAGEEEREITLTESFGVKCRAGTTFFDGVCVPDAEIAAAGEGFRASMGIISERGPLAPSSEDDPNISRVAMMGFTFAPPVIEWGYKIDEDVCVLGICIEIFYARIGYEFDLAVGLRLPVEIEALDLPDSVLAGNDFTLEASMTPLDFTAKQYSDFCVMHGLNNDWFISDCNRFGFPNFLDQMVPLIPANKKDGDEFVARYSVFAGLIVRVFGIPLLNWGIDSSLDIPAACTMMRILNAIKDLPEGVSVDQITALVGLLTGFGDGLEEDAIDVVNFVKEVAGACGTFTTPFGVDDEGLRAWPFSGEYNIRADCAEATVRGEIITVGGKPRPLCTNMVLGVSGASLGIGLGLEAQVGSRLITADFSTSEDATRSGDDLHWTRSTNEDSSAVGLTIRPDNYDPADFKDTARVAMDDFTYYLNALQVTLKANLEFGGILSPIPDIGSFPIYSFIVDSGTFGLPIPQHPGTEAVAINLPVENYGLKVDVRPESSDPAVRVDDRTLLIMPGTFGPYMVRTRNIGSRLGDFDNFRVAVSNRPDQTAPYSYFIDQNTDHDCVVTGGVCMGTPRLRGNPYDGIADDCYQANGGVRPDRDECINEDLPETVEGLSRDERDDDKDGIPDEDAPDVWATSPDSPAFGGLQIADLDPYTMSSLPPAPDFKSIRLSVNPFRHPLTRPGRYPFLVTADSVEAKAKSMAHTDPSGNRRVDATDTAFLVVQSFFEPQVVVLPNSDGGKAGVEKGYIVEGTNGGNSPDSMTVQNTFLDFNQGACTLTTLGRQPDGSVNCPYRAVPTAIQAGWTTVAGLPAVFPAPPGQLGPLDSSTAGFTIKPPTDWAGMDDTTYLFELKTESQTDPDSPPATRSFIARHKVTATKESMTRYIGLEITELTATLLAAEAAGVKLGGLKPVVTHPIQMMNNNALEAILIGNFSKASGNHSTNIQLMQAFVKMLGDGKSLPPALYNDLKNRSAAIIADMTAAQLSAIVSAP